MILVRVAWSPSQSGDVREVVRQWLVFAVGPWTAPGGSRRILAAVDVGVAVAVARGGIVLTSQAPCSTVGLPVVTRLGVGGEGGQKSLHTGVAAMTEVSRLPQISHRGEVVDVDHGQLLLAGPLGCVSGTSGSVMGQVVIVRGATFLITAKLVRRRRRTELLLVSGEVRGTDHLGVVRAVNGKQLVQQVGHLVAAETEHQDPEGKKTDYDQDIFRHVRNDADT